LDVLLIEFTQDMCRFGVFSLGDAFQQDERAPSAHEEGGYKTQADQKYIEKSHSDTCIHIILLFC
jgi:hypothetical protein